MIMVEMRHANAFYDASIDSESSIDSVSSIFLEFRPFFKCQECKARFLMGAVGLTNSHLAVVKFFLIFSF